MATGTAGEAAVSRGYSLVAPQTLRIEERELGELHLGWVRLRFLYCGLCGSDLSQFAGRPDGAYPVSVGHEFVAEVVAAGAGVDLIGPGDIVSSDLNYRCGSCDHCEAGRSHLCRVGQQGLFSNRAFSDFGDIEASYLVRLDGPPAKHLALCEPLSCVLHAKEWASLRRDDRVLVVGAGSIGTCMAFALSRQRPAHGFEITDVMPERLSRIAASISPTGHAVTDPEGEYDVVFDLSGTEDGLRSACAHTRAGGRICSMSHPTGDQVSPFLVYTILREDITFTVSYLNGEPIRLQEAARLLEREWDERWDSLIELLPLSRLQEAYENRPRSPWCKTIIDVAGAQGQMPR